ncbi:glutaminase B [Vibrio tetraodonis]|uniref:glutaminase B n=1 Tax=Vibrio tetraodonis TaxID=2231647 RepID=UPI000E0CB7B7|nr:glutaminase B [Vibrio tetraodonis]
MKPTKEILADILQEVRPLIGQGKVADYIPALANVPAKKLAIAVFTNQGKVIKAGDADEAFSIQSISKALSLTLAMDIYTPEEIWSRVGKEPSGQAFNSLIQLEMEQGIPRNPFINAGAIVVADMLQSRLSAPRQRLLEFVRQLSGDTHICYDKVVAASEMMHSDRNAAIAYLMRSFGNFDNDVIPVLNNYFHACALKMSCVDLAKTFSYLANKGTSVQTGKPVVTPTQTKQLNALLATCGLYDGAGEFAYRVGMPGKSGVGGGIIAIVPGEMTIAVWSPELDPSGNSLAGTRALELLSERIGRSIF